MIVRDLGDAWQIVLQTDHADLSAAFARAWATPLAPSLVVATERHDDGWAVWEQSPRFDEDGTPINFFDVDVRSHLAFYRAGIAAITEEDPYAGLLVSMHGAGIYRQRYGLDTSLGLTRAAEVQGDVDAFVAEQEAKFGGDPGERQADYAAAPAVRPALALLLHARRGRRRGARRCRVTGSSRSGRGGSGWRRTRSARARPFSLLRGSCRRMAPSTSSPRRRRRRRSRSSNPREVGLLRRRARGGTRASSSVCAEPAMSGSAAPERQSSRIAAARTGEPYADLEPQRQAVEQEALPEHVLQVVQVLVVRDAAFGARAVRRVRVGQVDEVGADRLDAEDLHAAVGHPVHCLGRDPAEPVEERGCARGAVVVVGAEQEDVAGAKLLATRLHGLGDFVGGHVVAALGYSRMSTQIASPQNVSSGISAIASAALLVVAERVDVGRRVVRGDDDLGVERRPSLAPRPSAGCGGGSALGGRTGAAGTRGRAAGERSIDTRGQATPFRPFPCTPGRSAGSRRRRSVRRSRRWRAWRRRPRPTR